MSRSSQTLIKLDSMIGLFFDIRLTEVNSFLAKYNLKNNIAYIKYFNIIFILYLNRLYMNTFA